MRLRWLLAFGPALLLLAPPAGAFADDRAGEAAPLSFQNDVLPILAKAGCNMGACHGAASGKGGFKLSLRGYDPAADFASLTRDASGRRINRLDPDASLVLQKPGGRVAHAGGLRLPWGGADWSTLRRWIAEGARTDVGQAPALDRLVVVPESRVFDRPGQVQPLRVSAVYADGSRRDVTGHALYTSNQEMTATVDDQGVVSLSGRGEAAIMVRYGSRVSVSRLAVVDTSVPFAWTDPPVNNEIDRLVWDRLKALRIEPSGLCTDAEFLRRATLDLTGLVPTIEEAKAFLADPSLDKRARKIDELMARPAYADVWALKWADLLGVRIEDVGLRPSGLGVEEVWPYYRWIRDAVASNMPYDRFVAAILAASGPSHQNPPAAFFRRYDTPEDEAETSAQVFFGIRLMCARCHDHPFEAWTQDDYYGYAAFFSQVARKRSLGKREWTVFADQKPPRMVHPRRGDAVRPKPLNAPALDLPPDRDARAELVAWATRRDNPMLARALVNRVWSYYLGRGIIDPVDDIRVAYPPSNPALLDWLTRSFVEWGYDVDRLVRTIVNSRVYQLSARTTPSNADDSSQFSHFYVRRLTAEQLVDVLGQVTGVGEEFQSYPGDPGKPTLTFPKDAHPRAAQLPDAKVKSPLLALFGRPARETPCECERDPSVTLGQALHLLNGEDIARRLSDPSGWLAQLLKAEDDDDKVVETIYLRFLGRYPEPAELEIHRRQRQSAADRAQAAEDIAWTVLNRREFLLNH